MNVKKREKKEHKKVRCFNISRKHFAAFKTRRKDVSSSIMSSAKFRRGSWLLAPRPSPLLSLFPSFTLLLSLFFPFSLPLLFNPYFFSVLFLLLSPFPPSSSFRTPSWWPLTPTAPSPFTLLPPPFLRLVYLSFSSFAFPSPSFLFTPHFLRCMS